MDFIAARTSRRWLWICFGIITDSCFSISRADHVTSSTYKLTSLVQREQMLLDHLTHVAQLASTVPQLEVNQKQITKLNRTIEILRRRHAPLQEDPSTLQHPVAAFRFIGRLKSDWDSVLNRDTTGKHGPGARFIENNLDTMRKVISNWRSWPTSSSATDAALGLVRISHVYSLYPAPRKHCGLSPSCTQMGTHCNDANKTLANSLGIEQRDAVKGDNVKFSSRPGKDWHGPATSFSNKSCYFTRNRLLSHWELNKMASWLPPSQMNEGRGSKRKDLVNRATISKTKNCAESQKERNHYSYNSLSAEDLRFIAEVAWHNRYCYEAKIWTALAELSQSTEKLGTNSEDCKSICTIETESRGRDVQFASRNEILNEECANKKDLDPYHEEIHQKYIKLCKESAEKSPRILDTRQSCRWCYVWPYVRYDEEVISSNPPVSRFYNVISSGDIEHVKRLAQSELNISELSSNVIENVQDVRVSQTAWLPNKTPTLHKLSTLVGDITGLDSSFSPVDTPAEVFQVVNYGLGGLYAPHEDSVRTSRGMGAETSRNLKNAGDRLATWMFYLSDVQLGGATVFPVLNISVSPIKGSAVLWYNLLRNGEPDTRLVHAGCPVAIGDKWIANKWIRERGQMFKRPCSLNPLQ